MKKFYVKDFTGGWFIGNFKPSLLEQPSFEVCYKQYEKGERESSHYQRKATEFTLVITGECIIGGTIFSSGEICVISPGESASFEALSSVSLVAIKTPSDPGDKVVE